LHHTTERYNLFYSGSQDGALCGNYRQ